MNTNATLLSISHQIPSHIPYRSRNTELCLEENFLARSSPLLSFLYHATTRSTSYIRPRSGIYTSLNARFRWPTWQLKAAFLVAKNDLPGMDQRPPTRMPIYGQPRGRASIDTSGWEGRA